MKNKIERVIIIMLIFIAVEIAYLVGFYTPNKEVYSNSENEILAENINENSNLDLNMRINIDDEILDCNTNLTNESECAIIMTDENVMSDDENIIENHKQIMINECEFSVIDESNLIDYYTDGNWYCYYLYCDGDVYVVTIKNNHVDVCVMLN